jgi:hypothetical protein
MPIFTEESKEFNLVRLQGNPAAGDVLVWNNSLNSFTNGVSITDTLPGLDGNAGKFLSTDGENFNWEPVSALTTDEYQVVLDSNGTLVLPDYNDTAGNGYAMIEGQTPTTGISIHIKDSESAWGFNTDGTLTLPGGASINNNANSLSIQPMMGVEGEGAIFQISSGSSSDGVGGDMRLWAGSGADFGMAGSVDIFGNNTVVRNELGQWTFGADQNLTVPGDIVFPNNSHISASDDRGGIQLTTSRGTVLFGNQPECVPTLLRHFHIMKDDPENVDLFLGDDNNYVKLPGSGETAYGVEIGTNVGNAYTWRFDTNGTFILPPDKLIKYPDGTVYGGSGSNNTINIDIDGGYYNSVYDETDLVLDGGGPV